MTDSTPSHPTPDPKKTPESSQPEASHPETPHPHTPTASPTPTATLTPGQIQAQAEPQQTQQPHAQAHPQTSGPAQSPPAPPAKNNNIGLIAALAVGALIGGVSGAGVTAIAFSNASAPIAQTPSSTNITVNDPGNATTVTAVAASAAASVVTISVTGEGAAGSGSGVFLDEEGHVLTNAHVATLSGATLDPAITVQTADGHLYPATLVGSDPIADLAVIKVKAKGAEFQPVTFADSNRLNVGDSVVALGAPLGLSNTVTSGIVSALNRSITVASSAVPESTDVEAPNEGGDENDNGGYGPFDFWEFDSRGTPSTGTPTARISLPVIQTDAAINPGNSGGALLDSDGQVIGINVAIASAGGSKQESGNIGVGFAIVSNLAKRVAAELIENGKASHGLLGATVFSVTDDPATSRGDTVGSVIKTVIRGGAAAEAGLRSGDIVTEFNGMPITSSTDLTAQVRVLAGGAQADLVYVRAGKEKTVTVTLGEL